MRLKKRAVTQQATRLEVTHGIVGKNANAESSPWRLPSSKWGSKQLSAGWQANLHEVR